MSFWSSPLARMKAIALGLLLLAAGLYVLATRLLALHPGWGYLQAFAEAAMELVRAGRPPWSAVRLRGAAVHDRQ